VRRPKPALANGDFMVKSKAWARSTVNVATVNADSTAMIVTVECSRKLEFFKQSQYPPTAWGLYRDLPYDAGPPAVDCEYM